jgi:hypothetical protein
MLLEMTAAVFDAEGVMGRRRDFGLPLFGHEPQCYRRD